MNCRLCGQPTAGLGKLCRDCDAALRRARKGSAVAGDVPPAPAEDTKATGAASVLPPPATPSAPRFAGRRVALWTVCGVIVTVGVYLGARAPDPVPALGSAATADGAAPPTASRVVVEPAQAPLPLPSLPTEGPAATAKPSTALPASPVSTPSASPPGSGRKGAAGAPAVKTSPVPAPENAPAPGKAANAGARTSPEASPPPDGQPPARLARATAAQAAGPTDRWKAMANAVAKCSEQGFIAGVICEQKVRLQYCDGAWDSVPQCSRPQRDQP